MRFIFPPIHAKITEIILIVLIAIGSKPQKKQNIKIGVSIILPIICGIAMIFGSLLIVKETFDPTALKFMPGLNLWQMLYVLLSFLGVLVTLVGADNISKIIKTKIGKDRWNTDEESFDQNRELIQTETSVNIPYLFRWKKKNNAGWINIDPFRGSLIIGPPGSGKTFGLINPAIRQMIAKNFCCCIYDFKFPALGEIAYYHYLMKKQKDKKYKHNFFVINLNEVEKSKRCNPFKKDYIATLADAQEIAEAMVSSLQKGGSGSGGSEQFFTQSAINFLSSCIYFFAEYDNGRFSSLPHILSFINHSYQEIFDTLFSNEELASLLSPFKTAYDNQAFDQLEGQIGTLKIFLSRLATKESFWIFTGDEIPLKITDRSNPSIIILASDPSTQDINSALYSAILNRLTRLINDKGNLPGAIIADEFPTIYIHKIDNVVATARSNRVAVVLGMQEIPQLKQFYKREVAETISAVAGNIFAAGARDKNTLDWLNKLFGKIKQKSQSISISNGQTNLSIQEKMDFMIPAGKIASLRTGEIVGMVARNEQSDTSEYKSSAVAGKINLNMNEIKQEEKNLPAMPVYYSFEGQKNEVLMANFRRVNREVDLIVEDVKELSSK